MSWMQIRLLMVSNIILVGVASISIGIIATLDEDSNFNYAKIAMTLTYALLLTD